MSSLKWFGTALLAVSIGACQVYDPALIRSDLCMSRQPPERPSAADAVDQEPLFFGLRDVKLKQDNGIWASIGFDLDRRCTYSPTYESECVVPARRSDSSLPWPEDGVDGIDNVYGHTLYDAAQQAVSLRPGNESFDIENSARMRMELGHGIPIVRIRNWNGTSDDPQVEVSVFQTVAMAAHEEGNGWTPERIQIVGGDALIDGNVNTPAEFPKWDGHDYAWILSDSIVNNDLSQPKVIDAQAYVRDGTLVVNFPGEVTILFPGDAIGLQVKLRDMRVTARLGEGQSLSQIVVAGRWPTEALLTAARYVDAEFCPNKLGYSLLTTTLNRNADVHADPNNGNPESDCDAVSFGVSFASGTRLRVQGHNAGIALVDRCVQ